MKFTLVAFSLIATAIAGVPVQDGGKVCKSGQSVVCAGGNGGLLTLGNVATGALGDSCSGGDVYCCEDKDLEGGLLNVDVNAQCSLNHVL
ncbi:hypothetical protein N7468_004903 [Penicillium chermesinum]|uniref:Hydrophobin n=1 Tax=Penicillium chermesinum TaxID=63820 RepID=A0A9W9P9F2_9EURO|nr:uncharacterized protein N7468_004903 [Penicillium chermesinum]KAJ5240284.1 hypothetical protein N7468_004903 [Penicillium chermesinum]KAJ6167152.1 hypothetical protein N7470_002599 [Penicillium chermesinum]